MAASTSAGSASPSLPEPERENARRLRCTRRFGRSIRWFAAEFLVVVTGVVVALAASDRAQRLRERALVREYNARVAEDLDRISQSIIRVLGWSHSVETSGMTVLSVLEDGSVIADSVLFLAGVYQASRLPVPDLNSIRSRTVNS